MLVGLLISSCTFAQDTVHTCYYDSTQNFINEAGVMTYIGQDVVVKPLSKYERETGYSDFYTEAFTVNSNVNDMKYILFPQKDNIYSMCSDYESLVYRMFTIVDVQKMENGNEFYPEYIFTLKDVNQDGFTCKYLYHASMPWTFNLVTVNHLLYLANTYCGHDMMVTNNLTAVNYTTEDTVSLPGNYHEWSCVDVGFNDESGELVLLLMDYDNSLYAMTNTEHMLSFINQRKYLLQNWNALVNKFGQDYMDDVMNGDIETGMHKYLLYMSWGIPDRIIRKSNEVSNYIYGNCTIIVKQDIVKNIRNK